MRLLLAGDGYFAIYSPTHECYVLIVPESQSWGLNCVPLTISGSSNDIAQAARFTALGQNQPAVLDFLHISKNASGMSFDGIDMNGMYLDGYDLSKCDFRKATGFGATSFINSKLCGADFTGLNLRGLDVTNASFVGAYLSGCDLTLAPVDFGGLPPDMSWAHLSGAILEFAYFGGFNFAHADLRQADCKGALFNGANLTGAKLAGAQLMGAHLNGSILAEADLTGANLEGTDLSGVDLTTTIMSTPLIQSTDPTAPTSFAHSTLPYAVIGLNWSCLDLTGATITGLAASLAGLNAAGAVLSGHIFEGCDLDGANFAGATLDGAVFSGASLVGGNKFSGAADLQETDFANAYMANADFTGAVLRGAKFDGAFMVECILTGADLTNAAIKDAAGSIPMQYYDETGRLTPQFPLPYPAGTFPAPASFSATTVCPNGAPYSVNTNDGMSMAQMMAATNPPTRWSPADQAMASKRRAPAGAEE